MKNIFNQKLSPTVKVNLFHGFEYETSEQLAEQYKQWLKSIDVNKYEGTIGGRLTFALKPTSLGLICIVKDTITETEFDLTEYNNW